MATQAELAGADAADVAAARQLVATYLNERYPTLSVTSGQLADLVLGPGTDALAAVDHRSAAQIASVNPEVALAAGGYDPAVLDAVLAGRGVTRKAAAKASGSFAIHLSSITGVTVPNNYRAYTADGTYFATSGSRRVLAPGSTASDTEVAAVTVPGGGYAVVVPATAVATGAAGNRPAGTALTAVSPLAAQTAVYVGADFSGGADAETDAALLARLPAATAPRTVTSAAGAKAVITDAVPDYSSVTVIGFGHEGMRRGRSVLTGQTPGRMDAIVRTADAPSRVRVPVTATLVGTSPYGSWRFELGTAQAPGRFLVEKVLQRGANLTTTGYAPTAVTTGYDVSTAAAPIDVRSAADAAFSKYSTATVTFSDPDTSTSGLTVNVSARSYDAVVRAVPDLDAAQAAVEDAAVRGAGGDCLVRGGSPVAVSVTAMATVQVGVTLTASVLASAVARAVNENGISRTLAASSVAARAAAYLPSGTALQLSSWTGTVYARDGTTSSVSGATGLTVSTDWSLGLGQDSVMFYADPEGVTASVQTVS